MEAAAVCWSVGTVTAGGSAGGVADKVLVAWETAECPPWPFGPRPKPLPRVWGKVGRVCGKVGRVCGKVVEVDGKVVEVGGPE